MTAKDYSKYEKMRDAGIEPKKVCASAIADGYKFADILPMMHAVFHFDLIHSKEAWIEAQGIASSLDEYQDRLLPDIVEALNEIENEVEQKYER